jgi:hypothetical protein
MLQAAEYQFPMRRFAKKYPRPGNNDPAHIIKSLSLEVLKRIV